MGTTRPAKEKSSNIKERRKGRENVGKKKNTGNKERGTEPRMQHTGTAKISIVPEQPRTEKKKKEEEREEKREEPGREWHFEKNPHFGLNKQRDR